MKLQIGDVLLVETVSDPTGQNLKTRPVVLVSDVEQLYGVAVSTQFDLPLQAHEVLLYDGKTRNRTGLSKPCVALCDWVVGFEVSQIVKKLGHVMPHQQTAITNNLNQQ